MQSRLFIEVLVLKSERLVRVPIDAFVLFQTTPGSVFAVPQEIAVDVGHLARYADLVGMEIAEVLFAVFGVVKDLRQRFVAVLVGVDIGVVAFVGVLLKQSRSVPDEVGAFRVGARPGEFVLALFGKASAERIIGVCPDFGIAGGLFDFGADELVF